MFLIRDPGIENEGGGATFFLSSEMPYFFAFYVIHSLYIYLCQEFLHSVIFRPNLVKTRAEFVHNLWENIVFSNH